MAHRRISSAGKAGPRDIPDVMKAAAVDHFGPPSTLALHDVPVPRPGPHEVLIARVPKGLELRDVGAVAATGLTALQGIDALELRPRHTVLIFGASGVPGRWRFNWPGNAGLMSSPRPPAQHRHGWSASSAPIACSTPGVRSPRIGFERSRPTDSTACLRSPEVPSSSAASTSCGPGDAWCTVTVTDSARCRAKEQPNGHAECRKRDC